MALLAKERAASCHTDLPPGDSSSFSHIGWNTDISAFGVTSFSDIVDAWFEEGKDFLYFSGKCKENATCQHYTQVLTSRCKLYLCICGVILLQMPHRYFYLCFGADVVCLNVLLLCSWCGPLRVTWAVPASCV